MLKHFFSPEPAIFAHRGLSVDFPENTILSFKKAAEMGADVIETDVHFTRDNGFAVFHDNTLERVNGKGNIADYTLSELRRFDAGYLFTKDNGRTYPFRGMGLQILSLEDLLDAFPEQRFNIDLKAKNTLQIDFYCDIIKKHKAENRVLTASEHYSNLKGIRKRLPEMATSCSMFEVIGIYLLFKTGLIYFKKSFRADAFQIPQAIGFSKIANRAIIRDLHNRGMRVHVWTINKEEDMRRLLDLGADAIITDDPALLKKVLGI